MTYYITTLKDTIGNNYIGINIPTGIVEPFLNELGDILGDDFEEYINLQKNRDHGHHHITIINVMEYNKLTKDMGMDKFTNSLEPIFKYEINDLRMLGIGTAQKNENRAYFIVCESDKLDSIRDRYNLPEQDFHTTLGFKYKDVFGVRKNEVLKKNSKFTQLLSQEYLKKENFEFLKKIENYGENPDIDIIPISLNSNFLKIKVGDYLLDVGITDDGKFRIFTKYKDINNVGRMPTTELISILTKNK